MVPRGTLSSVLMASVALWWRCQRSHAERSHAHGLAQQLASSGPTSSPIEHPNPMAVFPILVGEFVRRSHRDCGEKGYQTPHEVESKTIHAGQLQVPYATPAPSLASIDLSLKQSL